MIEAQDGGGALSFLADHRVIVSLLVLVAATAGLLAGRISDTVWVGIVGTLLPSPVFQNAPGTRQGGPK